MDAGQLVPDEITVRLLLDRLGRARRRPRRDPRRLPADRRAGPARSTRPSPSATRAVRVAVLVDVPAEELIRRMSGRWVCRAAGHPYHEIFSPPHVAGRVRPRRLGAVPALRRPAGDDPRPDGRSSSARWATVIEHYRASGVLRSVDGLQEIDTGRPTRSPRAVRRPASRPQGRPTAARRPADARHPQVAGRDRAGCGRPGRIVAEVLALVEESLRPGVSTAELDRLAERHIRGAKGVPSFLNYLGGRRYDAARPARLPGVDLHLDRQRDRPRHPGRPRDQGRASSSRWTSA